jgi:hypothetical protein
MKRFISVVLAAVLCLCIPLAAFADAGPPMMRQINCIVTNPNGATFYYRSFSSGEDTLETMVIPYGTELLISADFDYSDLFKDEEGLAGKSFGELNYNNEWGYVLLSDISSTEKSFPLENAQKITVPSTYIVTNKGGIKTYKGPSMLFEETGTIPDGTKIRLTYRDYNEEGNYSEAFYYAEYSGGKGWIHYHPFLDMTLLRVLDESNPLTGKLKVIGNDIHLLDLSSEPSDEETGEHTGYKEISDAIPVGTELNFKCYYDTVNSYALVNYKGVEGYVEFWTNHGDKPEFIVYVDEMLLTQKDCAVYSSHDESSITDAVIPAYTKLPYKGYVYYENDYGSSDWILTEYNNKEVWLNNSDYDICTWSDKYNEDTTFSSVVSDSAELVKAPSDPETVCTVSKTDVLAKLADFYSEEAVWYYCRVVGTDKEGWINQDELEQIPGYILPASELPAVEDITEETGEIDGEETEIANPHISVVTIIVICAVAAVAIALTAAVIILLIRKNKGAERK